MNENNDQQNNVLAFSSRLFVAFGLSVVVEAVLYFGFWLHPEPSYGLITSTTLSHLPGFLVGSMCGISYWPHIAQELFVVGANLCFLWPFFLLLVRLFCGPTRTHENRNA